MIEERRFTVRNIAHAFYIAVNETQGRSLPFPEPKFHKSGMAGAIHDIIGSARARARQASGKFWDTSIDEGKLIAHYDESHALGIFEQVEAAIVAGQRTRRGRERVERSGITPEAIKRAGGIMFADIV